MPMPMLTPPPTPPPILFHRIQLPPPPPPPPPTPPPASSSPCRNEAEEERSSSISRRRRRAGVVVVVWRQCWAWAVAAVVAWTILAGFYFVPCYHHHQQQQQQPPQSSSVRGWFASGWPSRSTSSEAVEQHTQKELVEDLEGMEDRMHRDSSSFSSLVSSLPEWMVEYLHWHSSIKQQLTPNNWHHYQYLVVRCYAKDRECGGASDRLQSLPYFVQLAYASQRLLLVHWTRPAPLEAFLVPPPLSNNNNHNNHHNLPSPQSLLRLDWTVPDWLAPHFPYPWRPLLFSRQASTQHFELVRNRSIPIIDAYDQSDDHGAAMYNSFRSNHNTTDSMLEPTFDQVLGPLWHATYVPSPPVAAALQQEQVKLGLLVPSSETGRSPASHSNDYYAALHVRSRYHVDRSSQTIMLQNAIHCALGLLLVHNNTSAAWSTTTDSNTERGNTKGPTTASRLLYVTTDSINATRYAVQYGNELLLSSANLSHYYRVVARNLHDLDAKDPLHLDRGSVYVNGGRRNGPKLDWDHYNASHYYDTFVDLYLLAGAQCTAFGVGGYGKWANRLSPNPNCFVDYSTKTCPRPGW